MRFGKPWFRRRLRRQVSASSPAAVDSIALLGRPPVNLDTPEIQRLVAGRRVLVSGAGGSIGSEICRQVARFGPSRLVLLDRSEAGLFEIDRDIGSTWVGCDARAVVADVGDRVRLEGVFAADRPHVVFHAAAHKHVPLMEANPGEAVKVNVLGTRNLAEAAARFDVEKFVLISTDKAVNPTSVMGATKRLAECVTQAAGRAAAGGFVAVRFGNVLGSSGSVVPIFARQIAAGGPVTVTHPDMKRFFMTIPEAAGLVMQAGAIGRGGEIFVLDMGPPVPIVDLARGMIAAAGLREGDDVSIRFTGVRPGEKLEEQLAGADEPTLATTHPKIRVWALPQTDPAWLEAGIARLEGVADASPAEVKRVLGEVLAEYHPATEDVMRLAA